ncbi:MAG: gamma carbonic anhydrase family protein [Elusimicrobiota bacterium]
MIFSIGTDSPQIHPSAFIHPTAEISGKVKIGAHVSIWGGCILRGDVDWIEVGEESNVQDGCVFHTSHGMPVKLEQGVTVGHRAVIHGSIVKSYSLIGMGAILLDKSIIEEKCLVAAGAVVREGGIIPVGQLAAGVPARVIRALTPNELEMILKRPSEYVKLAAVYKDALQKAHII